VKIKEKNQIGLLAVGWGEEKKKSIDNRGERRVSRGTTSLLVGPRDKGKKKANG